MIALKRVKLARLRFCVNGFVSIRVAPFQLLVDEVWLEAPEPTLDPQDREMIL